MPQFLDLPREIRDLIYMTILTSERPRPILGDSQWLFKFRRIFEPQSSHHGEYGCAYSLEQTPRPCGNFLQCSRQIHGEMMEAIERAKRRELMTVKLDCIAEDESFHYFTWLAVPLVKTTIREGKWCMPPWADRVLERYLTYHRSSSTLIHQLWVDVRLAGDRSAKWFRNSSAPDRTSWAICAALKRIFEKGPHFSNMKETGHETTIEELVLNVVAPPNVAQDKFLPEDFPTDGVRDGLVHPQTVARELLDVWNRIWAGDDFRGSFYQMLLARITRVRICVNDKTWRVRELRLELERGQAERRRIAARVGW